MQKLKGGVGISMEINGTSICFVNSFVGDKWESVSKLNAYHKKILNGMNFGWVDLNTRERSKKGKSFANHK